MMNKRGSELLREEVVFIIFYVVVLGILFISSSVISSGALVYEQSYAKKIALMIDSADAEDGVIRMTINMEKAYQIGKKNEIDLSKAVIIEDGKVRVRLGSGNGYSYNYFSGYDVKVARPMGQGQLGTISIEVRDA